jgi:hypothetical protein
VQSRVAPTPLFVVQGPHVPALDRRFRRRAE